MTEYLETADVARWLAESGWARTTDTVRAWADSGKLHVAARTPRGLRLFRREDVEALAAQFGKSGSAA